MATSELMITATLLELPVSRSRRLDADFAKLGELHHGLG